MKKIDEIAQSGLDELERMSNDASLKPPAGGKGRVVKILDALSIAEHLGVKETGKKRIPRKVVYTLGAAAAAAVAAGWVFYDSNTLRDTYDNPEMAYAEVRSVLTRMGEGVRKGMEGVEKGETLLSAPGRVIEKTLGSDNKEK